MKFSLEQRREKVSAALRAKFHGGPDGPWVYVEATFLDSVIYCVNGKEPQGEKRYSASYVIAENGDVTLGDPVEVNVVVTYSPVGESEGYMLAPAIIAEGEEDGSRWQVVVIEEGLSKNRNRYRRQVLEAASAKYEGARVYWDHAPGVRSARDLAGFISNVAGGLLEAHGGKFALTGVLNVTDPKLRTGLLEAHRLGKADLYGLSHDASARTQIVQEAAGAVRDVLEIQQVLSVDVVSRPAAGGRVVRLAAGDGGPDTVTQEQEIQMFEKLLAKLKALRPDVQVREGVTEDELLTLIEQVLAAKPTAPAAPASPAAPATTTGLTEDDRTMLREATIDRALHGVKLPETAAAKVRKDLTARASLTLTEAQAAVQEMVDLLAPFNDRAGNPNGDGSGVQLGESDAQKKLDALDGLFQGAPVNGQRFRGIKEAYIAITGDREMSGMVRDCRLLRETDYSRVSEAISASTFDAILGDSIRRQMVREYNQNPLFNDWEFLCDVVSASDFRTNRRTRMGGYGNLSAVLENGAYGALTSPADEESTYAVTKHGGYETISWETIKNDDMGAVRRIPTKLASAAARTLHSFVFTFLSGNAAIYDGTALFHATHNNLGATALDATTFAAARLAIMEQTEAGSSAALGLILRHLIVPPELEETAFNLFVRNTNNDETFVQSRKPIVHVVPTFTDANNWYASADKSQVPMIELAFLDGRREPDLIWNEAQSEGTVFTNDQFRLKIRHVYGGAVIDYRGLYGAVVV